MAILYPISTPGKTDRSGPYTRISRSTLHRKNGVLPQVVISPGRGGSHPVYRLTTTDRIAITRFFMMAE
ncbi:hypothetical protein [Methanosphaerula subterraneus]|uniref:hypothetical protein n=1 Tax=Methanosphaerula subterraneus TaxID=3350244 RepID=UPI003F83FAD6